MAEPENEVQAPDEANLVPQPGAQNPEVDPEGQGAELGLVRDVMLRLTVEVGSTAMAVGDVMQLEPGAVVELDRNVGDPADLLVNGTRIGRAEVTVEGDRLAIRVVELSSGDRKGS